MLIIAIFCEVLTLITKVHKIFMNFYAIFLKKAYKTFYKYAVAMI